MQLTEIKVTSRVNLGDYSHREITCTFVVNDDDKDSIDTAIKVVEWHAHKPERLLEYAKQKKLAESDDASVKAKAQKWVDHFDKTLAEIEG